MTSLARMFTAAVKGLSRHPSSLRTIAVILLIGHAGMTAISAISRATPPVDITPAPDWLEDALRAAADARWLILHTALTIAMAAALLTRRKRILSWACWASASLWMLQGLILGLWSRWSYPPASLTAPWTSILVGMMAWVCGWAWDISDEADTIANER